MTNIAKKTPLESAVDAKQMIIAQFLESQMVMTDVKVRHCVLHMSEYDPLISC